MWPFTILGEGTKAMSADENHLVPVIKEAENYDKLEKALADIRRDVYLHLIQKLKIDFLLFILIFLAVVSSPLILTFNLVIIVFFKLNFWLGVYNRLRVFILDNF